MNLLLIGAGGAAHNAYVPIIQLIRKRVKGVQLFDGDKFEKRNISRQALALGGFGLNKAVVMADWLQKATAITVVPEPRYFFHGCGNMQLQMNDCIIVMADNHRARREARDLADAAGCWLISCACENSSGEAWAYHRDNKGTPLDPFIMFPELETEDGDDPIKADGCMSEAALDKNPQTPYGNMLSAAMAVWLFNNVVLHEKHNDPLRPILANFNSVSFNTIRAYEYTDANAAS
jgi:hypothetical protein